MAAEGKIVASVAVDDGPSVIHAPYYFPFIRYATHGLVILEEFLALPGKPNVLKTKGLESNFAINPGRFGLSSKYPVQQQFMRSWKHPDKPKPEVCAIFRILSPEQSLEKYSSYLLKVTKKRGLANVEELLFHGTSRSCRLGETKSNVQLCTMPECYLCCIIRESFHVDKSGTSHSFQRFGKGIYTTSCSSKADSYFRDVSEGSPFRMVLINRVVVGKPRRVHHNRHRTLSPASYDSLIGIPGEVLNYEETVVYTDEAIRPAYLVVYAYSGSLKKTKVANFISKIFRTPLFDA